MCCAVCVVDMLHSRQIGAKGEEMYALVNDLISKYKTNVVICI